MSSRCVRAALIGLGAIGTSVATRAMDFDDVEIVGALVREPDKSRPVGSPPVVGTLDELLALEPDVVVEIAGHEALKQYGPPVLRAGYDLLFVAVGALAEPDFEAEFAKAAGESGRKAKVISGAIGALDAIAGASVGEIDIVTHTVRKPAATLLGPSDACNLSSSVEIFSGPVREGALLFPESVNVAAAVSLAGAGFDRTTLRVIADPTLERNRHEVDVQGEFGGLRFEIEGIPSPDNPKTGSLVAMSVIQQIRQQLPGIHVG